jgi:hypothetical protein
MGGEILKKDITEKYMKKFHLEKKDKDKVPLPSDFCYNKVNVAPDFETKFLISLEKGIFQFVGLSWNSNDPIHIKWNPQGRDVPSELLNGKPYIVGIYHNGRYSWNFEELKRKYLSLLVS